MSKKRSHKTHYNKIGIKARMGKIRPSPFSLYGPCGKRMYKKAREAGKAMQELIDKNAHFSERGKINIYFCPSCDAWHVGHSAWKK